MEKKKIVLKKKNFLHQLHSRYFYIFIKVILLQQIELQFLSLLFLFYKGLRHHNAC